MQTLVTSLAVFAFCDKKASVSASFMTATVPSAPSPYKQNVHGIDTIGKGFGRLSGNRGIAFHELLRLGDKLNVDVSKIPKDLFWADEVESGYARVNQHSDFFRLRRFARLLIARALGLLLRKGNLGKARAHSAAAQQLAEFPPVHIDTSFSAPTLCLLRMENWTARRNNTQWISTSRSRQSGDTPRFGTICRCWCGKGTSQKRRSGQW